MKKRLRFAGTIRQPDEAEQLRTAEIAHEPAAPHALAVSPKISVRLLPPGVSLVWPGAGDLSDAEAVPRYFEWDVVPGPETLQ